MKNNKNQNDDFTYVNNIKLSETAKKKLEYINGIFIFLSLYN